MGELRRRALGEGAARSAPTAPHATETPQGERRRSTGPERFWRRRRARVALVVCLALSALAHYAIAPFELPHGFQVNDVEGEAAIPVDLLPTEEAPPPEPPKEVVEPAPKADEDNKGKEPALASRPDAGVVHRDAGMIHDAGPLDAGGDASTSEVPDSGEHSASSTDGAVAQADSGSSAGPRDPEGIVGAAGAVQADVVLVMIFVNTQVIRQHPVGAKLGYLLRGIPQWDEFMSGTEIDPVRDTDWVLVSGPSLINTAHDIVLIHYGVSDAVIDRAVAVVSRKYEHGGPFDVGVNGVKASRIHADRAERVLLRPQPHVLAVVPPSVAQKVAHQLVGSRLRADLRPGEAVYLRLVNPHHPMPEIPEALTEMRLRVVPRTDLGADVLIDGDTKSPAEAVQAADELRRVIRRHDDAFTAMITHGLLDGVRVTTEGSVVKVRLVATLDQIQTIASLVGAFLGVQPDNPTAPTPSTTPHGTQR